MTRQWRAQGNARKGKRKKTPKEERTGERIFAVSSPAAEEEKGKGRGKKGGEGRTAPIILVMFLPIPNLTFVGKKGNVGKGGRGKKGFGNKGMGPAAKCGGKEKDWEKRKRGGRLC